jgi:hypothetical protein
MTRRRAQRAALFILPGLVLSLSAHAPPAWAQYTNKTGDVVGTIGGACTSSANTYGWPDVNGDVLKCVANVWTLVTQSVAAAGSTGYVGIGATTADAPLAVTGSTVNVGASSNHYRSVLSYYVGASTQTGTVDIKLPVAVYNNISLISFVIRGYDYGSTYGAWEVLCPRDLSSNLSQMCQILVPEIADTRPLRFVRASRTGQSNISPHAVPDTYTNPKAVQTASSSCGGTGSDATLDNAHVAKTISPGPLTCTGSSQLVGRPGRNDFHWMWVSTIGRSNWPVELDLEELFFHLRAKGNEIQSN